MDQTRHDPPERSTTEEPRVTIEMGGPNIVIRSTPAIDHSCTTALAHAVDAATDTDTVVVIDPEPIRCDDAFAHYAHLTTATTCSRHRTCRPTTVEVVATGIIRIAAERTSWNIDVSRGRFCQTDTPLDIRFIDSDAWTPVIAICVTPTRLSALTMDGTLISSIRAHGDGQTHSLPPTSRPARRQRRSALPPSTAA